MATFRFTIELDVEPLSGNENDLPDEADVLSCVHDLLGERADMDSELGISDITDVAIHPQGLSISTRQGEGYQAEDGAQTHIFQLQEMDGSGPPFSIGLIESSQDSTWVRDTVKQEWGLFQESEPDTDGEFPKWLQSKYPDKIRETQGLHFENILVY